MKQSKKIFSSTAVFLIAFCFQSCREELRGEVEKSPNGNTYLVFELGCDSLHVNGDIWPHNESVKGEVPAGICKIQCGKSDTGLSINIQEGTTFYFDYWGP